MFDIGGWELALIVVIAVFVIGPKELPATLRTFGRVMARVRSLTTSFRLHVDDMIREAELEDLRKAADAARRKDFGRIVEDAVDPDREVRAAFDEAADAARLDPRPLESEVAPPADTPPELPAADVSEDKPKP
jgi:sec-independent protein translocase protein TatB